MMSHASHSYKGEGKGRKVHQPDFRMWSGPQRLTSTSETDGVNAEQQIQAVATRIKCIVWLTAEKC